MRTDIETTGKERLRTVIEDSNRQQSIEQDSKGGKWKKPLVLFVLAIAIAVLVVKFDLGAKLKSINTWIEGLGPWGPAAFILAYAVTTVAAIPGSALTLAAGALFGVIFGTIWVSLGSTLGACLCFLISRYFARESIAGWLSNNKLFLKLDRLTERHGETMVAITRLVPVFPFNLLNYGFGLTRVPFWTYAFWSWLCMLPGTVLYVAGGAGVKEAIANRQVPWTMVIVVIVTLVIITVLVRRAQRVIQSDETLEKTSSSPVMESE